MRTFALVAVVIAALSASLSVAPSLAEPPPPHGALLALRGAGGCLGGGCPIRLRGLSHGELRLTASRSGRYVYAVRPFPAALAILRRDPRSGELAQLPGRRGCLVARAVDGCRVLPALRGRHRALRALGDGRLTVTLGHHRRLLLAEDPRTGTVRRLGIIHGCVLALDGPCVAPATVTAQREVIPVSAATALVTGYDHDSATFALIRRGADGAWRTVRGAAGCMTQTGNHGRCTALPCMEETATSAHLLDGGRILAVGGGDPDDEDTMYGFLATFQVTPGGGLTPLRCVTIPRSAVPVWLHPLPHSSTVLVAEMYGNRGTGLTWERIFAARPRSDGALGVPAPISGDLAGFEGELLLAPDARTLYDIGLGGSSIEASRVSASAVRRLPAPYGFPYRAPHLSGYGADDLIAPGDGRHVYAAMSGTQTRTAPAIRVYAVAR